jgi:uncharacterized membrane-anchored protein YitT (DUF2179 family)
MFKKWKTLNKKEKMQHIVKYVFVILGTLIISFAGIAFLLPTNINSGGLSGIGIIFTSVFGLTEATKEFVYNMVTLGATVIFWVIGLIFLGKDFALKTLLSSIVFPIGNALFTYVPGVADFTSSIYDLFVGIGNTPTTGDLILLSAFGGTFMGFGISMTFIAGGSSGGVDVLSILLEKYAHIKESIGVLLVDGTIIGTGVIISLIQKDQVLLRASMCGIVTAVLAAIIVELMYISTQQSYQADIISDKWEDISAYAQDELKRGATIINVKGGYKQEDRIVLRVVFGATQYHQLKAFIAKVDPKAFVTFTRTNATFGEGFLSHKKGK